MAGEDLWPGYTAPLMQTLRKCDLCLHLLGAARTALALLSWGYMGIVLPTYCLSPKGEQPSVQLISSALPASNPCCAASLQTSASLPRHET